MANHRSSKRLPERMLGASTVVALGALDRLGGATRYVDVEELTLEAFKDAPQFFRWRTRKEHASPEKVRMALVHANERASTALVTSNAKGEAWKLTAEGVAYLRENPVTAAAVQTAPTSPRNPSLLRMRAIRRHATFQRYRAGGRVADMERFELADMLLCPPDSSAPAVARKVDVARAAAADVEDTDVERFLSDVAKEVTRKWS